MHRRIALSIALAMSVILASLASSDSTTNAQPVQRYRFDTGVVALGADQELRVTSDWNGDGKDTVGVRFRQMEYTQDTCTGGVCKLAVSSQNVSAPMALMAGEALSVAVDPSDPSGNTYARVVVLSNNRNVRVTATIIDTATRRVVSHIIVANADPWGNSL